MPSKKRRCKCRPKNIETSTNLAALSIPPEIFVKICEHLRPIDLYSLSRVCRRYHQFLCTKESSITQDVWKLSRISFMPTLLAPPDGMDEHTYVNMILLEAGCQFCSRKVMPTVHWTFRVRCCQKCLVKKTLRYGINVISDVTGFGVIVISDGNLYEAIPKVDSFFIYHSDQTCQPAIRPFLNIQRHLFHVFPQKQ